MVKSEKSPTDTNNTSEKTGKSPLIKQEPCCSENTTLTSESTEQVTPSRVSPVLTSIKCEHCKRRGCSPKCHNYESYTSQSIGNNDISQNSSQDTNNSNVISSNVSAYTLTDSNPIQTQNEQTSAEAKQRNIQKALASGSGNTQLQSDNETNDIINKTQSTSNSKDTLKAESPQIADADDSDEFHEISSSEEDENESETEQNESESEEDESESAVKEEEFDDSDLEDILESMESKFILFYGNM